MSRQGAALLRIFIGILILFAVGAVAFFVFFPGEQIASEIASRLQTRLERPVSIEGVSFRLGGASRISLQNMTLGSSAKPDDPVREVTVERLDLTVRLLPLLRRDVQVTQLAFQQPVITIVNGAAGAPGDSLSEPQSDGKRTGDPGATGGSGAGAAGEMPLSVQIDRLSIEDGRLEVFDLAISDSLPTLEIGGLQEELSATLSSAGIIVLSGETQATTIALRNPAGTLGQGLEPRLRKTLRYDVENDRLEIDTATLSLGRIGVEARVQGTLSSLAAGTPAFDLSFEADPTQAETILAFVPREMLPQAQGVESRGMVSARGRISKSTPNASGDAALEYDIAVDLREGYISHPQFPRPIESLSLSARLQPDRIEVQNGRFKTGKSDLALQLTLDEPQTHRSLELGLQGTIDLEEAAALQPPAAAGSAEPLEMRGTAVAEVVMTGRIPRDRAPTPEDLNAVGTVTLQSVDLDGPDLVAPVRELSGQVAIKDRQLTTGELRGHLGRSDFNARGRVENFLDLRPNQPGTASLDVTVHSGFLDLDELMPPPDASASRGESGGESGSRDTGASTKGAAPTGGMEVLQRLDGSVDVRADRLLLRETEGIRASGRVILDRGVIGLQNVRARSFGGDVSLSGSMDMRRPDHPQFDLAVVVEGAKAAEVFSRESRFNRLNRLGGHLAGVVDLAADFKGALDDTSGLDWDTFTSIGNVKMSGVEMTGLPLQTRLASYLEAPLEPLQISDWLQPFHVEDGKLFVDQLSIKAGGIDLMGSGWQRLDGVIEYEFQMFLPQSMSQGVKAKVPAELAPALFDGSGKRVVLPVQVSGTWQQPKVALDNGKLSALARQRAEERLQAERDRVEQEIKDRAGGVLDDLKGKVLPQPAPADSANSATDTKTVEKEVKNLLKGILGGRK